jgi:DNA-binding NtrC family response regulator
VEDKLIFVVDDEPSVADFIAFLLTRQGYNTVKFYSPLQALAAATSAVPHLLVSDFKMHEMDGLTLATQVKEQNPNCKVLMMSGFGHEAVSHPARGNFEFLHKPVSVVDLLSKVNLALNV